MSIIKEKYVRIGEVRVIRCQADYMPVTPRVIPSAAARQELSYTNKSALIKAGTFRMENTPRVIKADIKPVFKPVSDISANKDNSKAVYIIYKSGTALQYSQRFTGMRLAPIEAKEKLAPASSVAEPVVAPLVRVEPAPAVTNAEFVPQLAILEKKNHAPNYLVREATKAYQAQMPEEVIDVQARTTAIESFSFTKFTFNPKGLWARARGFIRGLGIDQGFEYVAKNLYRPEVYVFERVRILPR